MPMVPASTSPKASNPRGATNNQQEFSAVIPVFGPRQVHARCNTKYKLRRFCHNYVLFLSLISFSSVNSQSSMSNSFAI
jgi:hypothetical protein